MSNRYSNKLYYYLYSFIFGYNEKKYWKRRTIVTDPQNKTFLIIKLWYLVYLKRAEARNACSLGTALNAGAKFASVPNLPHGITGIFVSHSAEIGENCTILQNVTIGSSKKKAPRIGNNCVIGAGAVIIGGITIGDNCNIGANATVFKNVPSNTTVVCQPPRYVVHTEIKGNSNTFKF